MGRYRQDDGSTSSGHNSELFSNEIFNWHLPRYSLHEAAGINLRSSESPLLIIWTFLLLPECKRASEMGAFTLTQLQEEGYGDGDSSQDSSFQNRLAGCVFSWPTQIPLLKHPECQAQITILCTCHSLEPKSSFNCVHSQVLCGHWAITLSPESLQFSLFETTLFLQETKRQKAEKSGASKVHYNPRVYVPMASY